MIKRLDQAAQEEFDRRVREFRDRTKKDWNVFTGRKFESSFSNTFTNWVERFDYDSQSSAVVKAPKKFSNLRYNTQIRLFNLFGRKGFEFASTEQRIAYEKQQLEKLHAADCNVPELIYTSVDDVVVTEYIEGDNCSDVVRKEYVKEHIGMAAEAARSLRDIHRITLHGDPTYNNGRRAKDKKVWWVDPEFIMKEPESRDERIELTAQETAYFMFSTASHMIRSNPRKDVLVPTIRIMFDFYAGETDSEGKEVLRLTPNYETTNPLFTWPIYFIGRRTAKAIKQAITEEAKKV